MPNLLAMSFEGRVTPSLDLRCLRPGRRPPDGWGLGYYPDGDAAAAVLKEPAPPPGSIRSELVRDWGHLASTVFVLHVRAATWGRISDANTQPFARSWGGRDWLYAHSGSLRYRLEIGPRSRFEPVGSTDTELIFCELLGRAADLGWRGLADIDPDLLRLWFDGMNDHGSLTSVLTDGRDLCAYADRRGEGDLYVLESAAAPGLGLADADVTLSLAPHGEASPPGVIFASDPMAVTGSAAAWRRVEPGNLVVVRDGRIRAEAVPMSLGLPPESLPSVVPRVAVQRPARAAVRRVGVVHRTVYRYAQAVGHSTHLLRLQPVHDRLQTLLDHEVRISVDGPQRAYADVFGNRVRRLVLQSPYTELAIEARSRLELLDVDPLSFRPLHERSTIPLVWMPWQRQVLHAFLLAPELPDSELEELTAHAMSFVERNDYDLLDTLLDLTSALARDYVLTPGAAPAASPFDVYARRRGAGEDLTTLFICLARLLGVPARYARGYLAPRATHAAAPPGVAGAHAWAQVYLPEAGWKGFDPTCGILTQTDHVRVAVGRHASDATPTSGTLYAGGGGEVLEFDVEVTPEP